MRDSRKDTQWLGYSSCATPQELSHPASRTFDLSSVHSSETFKVLRSARQAGPTETGQRTGDSERHHVEWPDARMQWNYAAVQVLGIGPTRPPTTWNGVRPRHLPTWERSRSDDISALLSKQNLRGCEPSNCYQRRVHTRVTRESLQRLSVWRLLSMLLARTCHHLHHAEGHQLTRKAAHESRRVKVLTKQLLQDLLITNVTGDSGEKVCTSLLRPPSSSQLDRTPWCQFPCLSTARLSSTGHPYSDDDTKHRPCCPPERRAGAASQGPWPWKPWGSDTAAEPGDCQRTSPWCHKAKDWPRKLHVWHGSLLQQHLCVPTTRPLQITIGAKQTTHSWPGPLPRW